MAPKSLSQAAVRGLMIAAQGLDDHPRLPASKGDILDLLHKIRVLQIDSINVVARAPYFVLWSHLGAFEPKWLDELLEEVALFEGWASGNCLIPIEDYPLFRVGVRALDGNGIAQWLDNNADVVEEVMNHIREYGETAATDFVRNDGVKYTWDKPKPEARALDYLYVTGELMVRRRFNFARLFDLTERVYPAAASLPELTAEESHDRLILNTVKAFGVTTEAWMYPYYRLKRAWITASVKRLLKAGKLRTVAVDGLDKPAYYVPDDEAKVEAAADGVIPQSTTTILNPFDRLVWDRGRVNDLFGFDYPAEYYFPEKKRRYGFFSMPILYKNALVGRLDPKALRKEGIFEVKTLLMEPGIEPDDEFVAALKAVLHDCAAWHGTPQVVVRYANEPELAERLNAGG